MIGFSDTESCVPSQALVALLEQIAPTDEIGRPVKADAARAVPVKIRTEQPVLLTSENGSHSVFLALDGDWHGLHLTGLKQTWAEESDYWVLELQFGDQPQQVVAALNGLGFALPTDGVRSTGGELETHLRVEAAENGARFTCST